ncbi:MAG: hypothetical protein FD127_2200 [Acidimicrobiaceae bacterium]|nr:MAG: hypothetical protein FD127_2200 [Acidimicrobiaceae bacterium]
MLYQLSYCPLEGEPTLPARSEGASYDIGPADAAR